MQLESNAGQQEQLGQVDGRGPEADLGRLRIADQLTPRGVRQPAIGPLSRKPPLEVAARGGAEGRRGEKQRLRRGPPGPELLRAVVQPFDFICAAIILVVLYSLAIEFVWLNFATHARYWIPYQVYPLF